VQVYLYSELFKLLFLAIQILNKPPLERKHQFLFDVKFFDQDHLERNIMDYLLLLAQNNVFNTIKLHSLKNPFYPSYIITVYLPDWPIKSNNQTTKPPFQLLAMNHLTHGPTNQPIKGSLPPLASTNQSKGAYLR